MFDILLIFAAIFGGLHALRDYLQSHSVWNDFTRFGHFWNAPQLEWLSLDISLGIAVLAIGILIWRHI